MINIQLSKKKLKGFNVREIKQKNTLTLIDGTISDLVLDIKIKNNGTKSVWVRW